MSSTLPPNYGHRTASGPDYRTPSTLLRSPSVAASMIVLQARLMKKSGMSELLLRARVPHQPVWAPAKFENFLVEHSEHPGRMAHVVRAAVVVPVEDVRTATIRT